MITTIQLHGEVKNELAALKQANESYEEVIKRLIAESDMSKQSNKELLIEGCKVMAEESLKICKEFEAAEPEWPEWRE